MHANRYKYEADKMNFAYNPVPLFARSYCAQKCHLC
jgi:hypothetical protein